MDFLRLPPSIRTQAFASLHINIARCSLSTVHTASSSNAVPPPTLAPPAPSALLELSSHTLNAYTISTPPNPDQIKQANRFFVAQPPAHLFSCAQFRALPASHHAEIAFLGRSNVGKSSLLNALFNRNGVAHTSRKPGKTKLMNGFGVSPVRLSSAPRSGTKGEIMADSWRRFQGGFVVVDMPGYGKGSRADWGAEVMKFLEQRKQLKRAFLLVDCEHGLKSTDLTLLTHLYRRGVPHSIVLSKVDKLLYPQAKPPTRLQLHNRLGKLRRQIDEVRTQLKLEAWNGRDAPSDVLCVSSEKSLDEVTGGRRKIGIDELRWAAMCACGFDRLEKLKPSAIETTSGYKASEGAKPYMPFG